LRVRDNLYWVGILNPGLRCFDFIPTRFGTTYNSYLITGPKPTLVDGAFGKYSRLYLDKIAAIMPPEKLSYLVINHTEHDHSSAIGAVLDAAPGITVVGTQTAIDFLKLILNRDFRSQAVEDNDRLDLGERHLRFFRVPFWHWPDTMFSYIEEDKVLFSCDGFGAHFCDERMFDDQVDDFANEFHEYYNHIMRAFAPKIRDGLACIRDLPIEVIAPSHGPILRTDPKRYIRQYEQWAMPMTGARKRVVVFYASIYRSTYRIAKAIAAGAGEASDVRLVDAFELDPELARDEIEKSDGLLFGSVTLNGDAAAAMWSLLAQLSTVSRSGKKAAAFGSYGWSGEAVALIEERLRGLRIPIIKSELRFRFTPTDADLDRARAFGREFVKQL
jgi:NADH oxidase (H2O-forming)